MTKIVVGVSGKETSHPAIEWAMDFAQSTHASVEFVHVVDTTWGAVPPDFLEAALLAAEERLREIADKAQDEHPQVAVSAHVAVGATTAMLTLAAENADFLVIGAHPGGRYPGSGRRPVRIAGQASCSVIVVPAHGEPSGTGVVVGVDGSEDSAAAVAFAAEVADRVGERLTVIHSWASPEAWGLIEPSLIPIEPGDDDRLILAEAVAGLADQYPDLPIVTRVSAASPLRALYAASLAARMVVVGSRGRHGLIKALLGSVSEELVADLPCTVVVIRPSRVTVEG